MFVLFSADRSQRWRCFCSASAIELMRSAAPAMIMSYSRRYDGGGSGRKTQLLHAQSEPLIAERERASVARVALRVGKALDQFPCVLWTADFRPNYQGMERNPLSERS